MKFHFLSALAASVMASDPETLVVNMQNLAEDDDIAGLTCSGLMNRDDSQQLAWTMRNGDDSKWWKIFSANHPNK